MLWGLLGFLITIGLLVTIHEYGHFIVARWFGVKILRFSLGFGKPIFTWVGKKEGTKYTLSPIPLGGFVQMYGEESEEEIPEQERHRTFSGKPAWQRFLIAFAGPAVNLIFAVFAFALLYMSGVEGITPTVIHVTPHSLAAEAGLEKGDRLTEVDGHSVKLATDAHVAMVNAPRETIELHFLRGGEDRQTTLDLSSLQAGDELNMASRLGVYLADQWWPATVREVIEGSAAAQAGIQAGDEIVRLNGVVVNPESGSFYVSDQVAVQAGKPFVIEVLRNGQTVAVQGVFGERELNGETYGFLGVVWDRVPDSTFFDQYQQIERYGVIPALGKGVEKTAYYVQMTFNMFARMIRQEVSIDNIGGPITIGDAAGKTLRIGWDVFLNFLGVVSLSLAAINLLPIPMLDGGHMLLNLIEMIRRKPLSQTAMIVVYRAGAAVVISFMAFVVLMDLWRYF